MNKFICSFFFALMKAFALIGSQNDVGEKAFNDFSDLQAIT
jgi:hypothetical protein